MHRHWHIAVLAGVLASAGALADDSQYGPVGGDTLWAVAGKINAQKRLGTIAQVAWALYVTNPQAFDGSPGKVKATAMLVIPDAATVTSITNLDAYARLTGSPAGPATPVVTAPASAPVATAPRATPVAAAAVPVSKPKAEPRLRADAHAPPLVTAVELKPARNGTQWLGVLGENFRPGATLELRDMLNGTVFRGQAPARLDGSRIDYEARVGHAQSHWLLTVRNADGTISEAYGFAAGPVAVSADPDPVAQAAAEAKKRAEAEQASHVQPEQERLAAEAASMQKASSKPPSSAELDREFEEKMTADRVAYEKAEAEKKARAKKE